MPRQNDMPESARRRQAKGRSDGGDLRPTVVYTDGACSGNPGPGGWGWVIPNGRYRSGAEPHTTNQRMELAAALDAVRSIDGPLEIMSDSSYVVNCFRQGWWKGWLRRGWVNSKKQPVANRDLWEPLVEAYQTRVIDFRWVKGHAGNRWNDFADRLAVEASRTGQGMEGEGRLAAARPRPAGRRDGSRSLHQSSSHPPVEFPSSGGIVLYAAGYCPSGRSSGGWAWLVARKRYRSGFSERTTTPRMELTAALDALNTLEGAIELVSDSTYLVNCYINRWWERWLSRGWHNSKGKPVANRDLWEPIIETFRSGRVTLRMPDPADVEWPGTAMWLASEAARTGQDAEGAVPGPVT